VSASDSLRDAAFEVMGRAYAPYSNFRVGAALRTSSGTTYLGCNVENASYTAGICAERGAVLAAVAHGDRDFERLVIATEALVPAAPCGECRQVLGEFGREIDILSVTSGGKERRWTLSQLLPHPFTPSSLDRA
jgi:cytidine deaminase